MLLALGCMDAIVIFEEDDPRELLKIVKPRYHVRLKMDIKELRWKLLRLMAGKLF